MPFETGDLQGQSDCGDARHGQVGERPGSAVVQHRRPIPAVQARPAKLDDLPERGESVRSQGLRVNEERTGCA